jgi:hypothetical protein
MVDKVVLGQVFSQYFGFPCQSSFHRLLHNHHHLPSGAGTIGQQWPTYQVDSVSPHPEKLKRNPGGRLINAGQMARSQFASGRSCDRQNRSRFGVVFLVPRANAELIPKFHVALHASHAALPMVTSKFRSNHWPGVITIFEHCIFVTYKITSLVVRVSGYRSRGPGFDFRRFQIF